MPYGTSIPNKFDEIKSQMSFFLIFCNYFWGFEGKNRVLWYHKENCNATFAMLFVDKNCCFFGVPIPQQHQHSPASNAPAYPSYYKTDTLSFAYYHPIRHEPHLRSSRKPVKTGDSG